MTRPRLTYANVVATAALVAAAGGGAIALADSGTEISACVRKAGATQPGAPRIVPAGTTCNANEDPLTWNQQGIQGDPGPAGSPDTPAQVLAKIEQVDGDGSGLDASLLDGNDSTAFLLTSGKAADANKLDNLDSTAFVRKGAFGTGTIGLSAIGANSCSDVVFNIGGVKVGDVAALNVLSGDSLPARLTMDPLDVPSDGKLNVRICNGTSAASVADSAIKVRWATIR